MAYAIRHKAQIQAASGLDVIAGVWLIVSPWVVHFNHAPSAPTNNVIFGIIIGLLALIRAGGAYRAAWLSWINAVLGLWVLVSPWVLSFQDYHGALWTNVITGIAVIILAVWSALVSESETGGVQQIRP